MKLNVLVAAACFALAACVPRGPVLDTTPPPEGVGGTIAGAVFAAGGTTPLSGRKVTAVDEASGARFDTSTGTNGGYAVKVPAGTYRLDVELRAGEAIEKRPEPTEVNVGDLDPDRDFVLTVRQ
jgi:hypothetical protein